MSSESEAQAMLLGGKTLDPNPENAKQTPPEMPKKANVLAGHVRHNSNNLDITTVYMKSYQELYFVWRYHHTKTHTGN